MTQNTMPIARRRGNTGNGGQVSQATMPAPAEAGQIVDAEVVEATDAATDAEVADLPPTTTLAPNLLLQVQPALQSQPQHPAGFHPAKRPSARRGVASSGGPASSGGKRKHAGRQPSLDADQTKAMLASLAAGMGKKEAAKTFKVSEMTITRYAAKAGVAIAGSTGPRKTRGKNKRKLAAKTAAKPAAKPQKRAKRTRRTKAQMQAAAQAAPAKSVKVQAQGNTITIAQLGQILQLNESLAGLGLKLVIAKS